MKKPEEILEEFRLKISAIPDKKEKVEEILEFVLIYGDSFGEQIIDSLEEGMRLSREINFKGGEVGCYYNMLFFSGMTKGNVNAKYNHTVEELHEMLDSIKDDEDWYAMGLNLLAFFHWFKGEYEIAFDLIFKATKLPHGSKNFSLGWNTFGLAVFYFDTKDYENAKIQYQKAFDLFDNLGQDYGKARTANGLASVAIMQNNSKEALPLLEFSTKIYRDYSHHSGLSRALNDMGLLEKLNKNYSRAVELLEESIELRKEINHLQGLITCYTELGEIYLLIKDHRSALAELTKGMDLATQIKALQKQMRLHKLLYDTYKELKKTDLALENLEKYYEIKSQILSDESANNIKKIQTKFEKEKSEKEAEIERLKNVELKIAYREIEEKNKEIIDSITYALRIQISLLPTEKYILKSLDRLKIKS